jgi:hypothetical protein
MHAKNHRDECLPLAQANGLPDGEGSGRLPEDSPCDHDGAMGVPCASRMVPPFVRTRLDVEYAIE